MTTEEAKKIADAIVLGMTATYGKTPTADELKQKCIKILTADTAAPVEKEYRAGEWVPQVQQFYCSLGNDGSALKYFWVNRQSDLYRLSQGNVFPTEAIAEAAKKYAEFWRAFDMADECGGWGIFVRNGRLLVGRLEVLDGTPRWQLEKSARAWIAANGGEAYVSEMLTKGRVFRFKWGGE